MKKLFALCLLCALLILCLVACGDGKTETNWNTVNSGNTETQTGETEATFAGSGSALDPYKIGTPRDLFSMASLVNDENRDYRDAYYVLTGDIDLEGKEWTPIGDGYSDGCKSFSGSFDGRGFTIRGLALSCDQETEGSYFGLFGLVSEGGVIKNLTVASSQIDCSGKDSAVLGAIAGRMEHNTTMENCYLTADVQVKGSYTTGGLVGELCGAMTGCSNEGAVIGTSEAGRVGGLVGQISGNVNYDLATIAQSSNTGNVEGARDVGGIVGHMMDSLLDSCSNSGNVTGETAGGIVGVINAAETDGSVAEYMISHCANSGCITATVTAGGIAGDAGITTGNVTIVGCSNAGILTALNMGGILGEGRTSAEGAAVMISDCLNTGVLAYSPEEGQVNIGGIVATLTGKDGGSFMLCDNKNTGDIDCDNGQAGGILAKFVSGMGAGHSVSLDIESCSNEGNIYGGSMGLGGIVGEIAARDEPYVFLNVIGCSNSGDLYGRDACVRVGGIIGVIQPHYCEAVIAGCINSGDMNCEAVHITREEKNLLDFEAAMGGIVGYVGANGITLDREDDCGRSGETVVIFENCESTGNMGTPNELVDYYTDTICGFSAVGVDIH